MLEIGTGWGSFAIEAVRKTGCRVTTITASSEQADLARRRVREAGFEEEVVVLLCDYRHVPLPHAGSVAYLFRIAHTPLRDRESYGCFVDHDLRRSSELNDGVQALARPFVPSME